MNSSLTESLLAGIPMPLVLIGPDQRIKAVNSAAGEMFGATAKGRPYQAILRQPNLIQCIETGLSSPTTSTARYVDRTMTRETIYLVRAAPVQSTTGQGVIVSFHDTTESERVGEMRRDFVANVSHELKSPLTALLGFIETLRGAARDDPDARDRFLIIMQREAERMNRLVSDLLSLSRVESSERQVPTGRVDVRELANSVRTLLLPQAEAKGMTLEVAPEEAGRIAPLLVAGDRDQLQQVLVNLVENAIKYGRSGTSVKILLSGQERELAFRGPGVRIVVVDDGDGIDPIHIPRLTERFYRVDNHRSREMGGTGLGLAIAKHIVNRHRGRLQIESAPGKGARFTILLPGLT